MIKLLTKIMVLSCIVIAMMSALSSCLDGFFTSKFKDEKPFWFFNKAQASYDFAVIGSSRGENLVDVNTIEKATGTKGINLSMQGTGNAGLYLILKGFVERRNKVRTLLIQVDEYSLDAKKSYINEFPTHAYLPYFADRSIRQVIEEKSDHGKFLLWQYLPFSRYVDYNSYYLAYGLNYLLGKRNTGLDKFKGTSLESNSAPYKFDYNKYQIVKRKIDDCDVLYLNKILQYAKGKGMSVVLFTAPQYYKVLPYLNTRYDCIRIFGAVARRNKVTYLNYEEDGMCKNAGYFFDNTHLNSTGSVKFSAKLAIDVKDMLHSDTETANKLASLGNGR